MCAPGRQIARKGKGKPMPTMDSHIYDVYNSAYQKMSEKAPHLIAPLVKALTLALEDHVCFAPPPRYPGIAVVPLVARVYSQRETSNRQYTVFFDRRWNRFTCDCPSFALKQFKLPDGRIWCKHMIAVQLMLRANRAYIDSHIASETAEMIILNANIAAQLALQDRYSETPATGKLSPVPA